LGIRARQARHGRLVRRYGHAAFRSCGCCRR
jgi:hypothetical protein